MLHYINQSHTLSFPICLVKTESEFIVRSVESDLGRWTLVIAVISIDAYPFLTFSKLTCHLDNTGISVSWLHLPLDGNKTKLGSSFIAMSCMEVCPYSYFWWCGYFWDSWESFVVTDGFSVRVTKITSTIGVSWTHTLPFCFWPIFNSMSYGHIYHEKDV